MSDTHSAVTETNHGISVNLVDYPDECPLCHVKGTYRPHNLFSNSQKHGVEAVTVVYRCPNSECYEVFLGYYTNVGGQECVFDRSAPITYVQREFSEIINEISSEFVKIYNQSKQAETIELNEICGPGYRKSLEFLIKDYLMSKSTTAEEKEAIKSEQLGTCIGNRITDANIKGVAKRAAWLGNDETHYVRKWETKDLQDLKKLIDLTVHWIEAEALTTQLLKDMPDA